MDRISVLVTGVGGGGHGEQILKALKLAETDYILIAGDMNPYSKGLFDADYAYVLPPAGDPLYIEALLEVCRRHKVAAVFHGSEPELKVMSAKRDVFENNSLFLPINPTEVIAICMDKLRTAEFLRSRNFQVPDYWRVSSTEDLDGIAAFPVILKPSVGSGGSANTFLAQDRQELIHFGRYLLSMYSEFVVQQYVGTPDSEYTVGVLLGMDGVLLNSIAVKRNILSSLSCRLKARNRTARKDLGDMLVISSGVSQGEIGPFPEVTGQCEAIARALGARGALNIQCRLVDGRVHVFEINPRFSGTTSLRALVGYNEPDVLIRRHILNEKIEPHFPYRSGVIVRGLCETLIDPQNLPGSVL